MGDALCPKIVGQASLLSKKLLSLLTATTSTCDTISKTIYFKMFINIIKTEKIFQACYFQVTKTVVTVTTVVKLQTKYHTYLVCLWRSSQAKYQYIVLENVPKYTNTFDNTGWYADNPIIPEEISIVGNPFEFPWEK